MAKYNNQTLLKHAKRLSWRMGRYVDVVGEPKLNPSFASPDEVPVTFEWSCRGFLRDENEWKGRVSILPNGCTTITSGNRYLDPGLKSLSHFCNDSPFSNTGIHQLKDRHLDIWMESLIDLEHELMREGSTQLTLGLESDAISSTGLGQ